MGANLPPLPISAVCLLVLIYMTVFMKSKCIFLLDNVHVCNDKGNSLFSKLRTYVQKLKNFVKVTKGTGSSVGKSWFSGYS